MTNAATEKAKLDVVNLREKFSCFSEHYKPHIIGEVNDCHVKAVKFKGEFVWHHHEKEDELFLVVKGSFRMKFRDREVAVREGEFVIVPRGVEHCPVADDEVQVVLIEPKTTLNTGNITNERTLPKLERI
jgi:mannose-6-phosphate isomerase-like protein (cupin superfamily)